MADVAIVTDSNSGISVEEGRAMGVTVIPMPVHINGKIFYEGLDITQKEFYDRLIEGADVATSQPAPGDLLDVWNRLLGQHREIVYIPMSAGLSASCATAQVLAEDFEGRVQVVDNRRISVTQRHSVLDALALARQGLDAAETKRILEEQAMDACIYITVDTLKYLRKGGRVTGVEAVAGTMLNIKPVMHVDDEGHLTKVGTARGRNASLKALVDHMAETAIDPAGQTVFISHGDCEEDANKVAEDVKRRFGVQTVVLNNVGPVIGAHSGPGTVALFFLGRHR